MTAAAAAIQPEPATPKAAAAATGFTMAMGNFGAMISGAGIGWLKDVTPTLTADLRSSLPAGVAAVVALLVAAYAFFRDLVDAQLGTATLRAMRYGLGVLVASAAVSAYHGAVFRQDRQIDVPDRPSRPRPARFPRR